MAVTEEHTEEATEGGFGTGLRRQLEARAAMTEAVEAEAPRSPGEAVAAAAPSPPAGDTGVDELRAELDASLARELALRSSLDDKLEHSAREAQLDQRALEFEQREVQFEQEVARRIAELEDRAGALAAHESRAPCPGGAARRATRRVRRASRGAPARAGGARRRGGPGLAARAGGRPQGARADGRPTSRGPRRPRISRSRSRGSLSASGCWRRPRPETLARREELAKEAEKLDQLAADRERGFDAAERDLVERRKLIEAAERALTAAQADLTKKNDELAKRAVAQEQEQARVHGLSVELEREQARVQAQRVQVDALRAEAESSRRLGLVAAERRARPARDGDRGTRGGGAPARGGVCGAQRRRCRSRRTAPPPVDEVAQKRVQERERALAEREARLEKLEALADASRQRLEEKEHKIDSRDEELRLVLHNLEERGAALDRREAQLIAEHEVQEQRLEERERLCAELAERLTSRESDLQTYVRRAAGPVRERGRLVGEAARHEAGGFCGLREGV